MKSRLKRAIGETKLTFEEFATVLAQIEACLNSRPHAPLPCDGDTVEPLTPGHFLIGRPLEVLPDPQALTVLSLFSNVGIFVKISFDISGRGGLVNTLTFADLTNGITPPIICK